MHLFVLAGALALSATVVLTSFCGSCAQPATGGAAEAVRLQLHFPPGSRFAYVVQTGMERQVRGQQSRQQVTTYYTFVVRAGKETMTSLGLTYERQVTPVDATSRPSVIQRPDSITRRKPTTSLAGSIAPVALGVQLTAQGEVRSLVGVDSLRQRPLASRTIPAAQQPFELLLEERALKSSLNQLFDFYPGHAVRPGESWTIEVPLNWTADAMQLTNTYTLVGVEHGVAHLRTAGKLTVNGEGVYTGTQSGTLDVDVATGLVLRGNVHRVLSGHTGPFAVETVTDSNVTGRQL